MLGYYSLCIFCKNSINNFNSLFILSVQYNTGYDFFKITTILDEAGGNVRAGHTL